MAGSREAAAGRRGGRGRGGVGGWLRVVALLGLLGCSSALFGLDALGGTYRYGHIYWTGEGNRVHITIETAFRRNVGTTYFEGSAPDGFAQVGDTITLTGRETPRLFLGDSTMLDVLHMQVQAYSVAEDWILGTVEVTHTYPTPTNGGQPWMVQYTGCCRLSNLQNNKDQQWVLTAKIDLTASTSSPRVRMLPVVNVPFENQVSFLIPATTADNREAMHWAFADPFTVGSAARFTATQMSQITVPLQPLYQNSTWGFSNACVLRPTDAACNPPAGGVPVQSIGPDHFFRLLRTDNLDLALTVEGWVKSLTDAGGVVLSTGRDTSAAAPPECAGAAGVAKGRCDVSTLMVKVNATHVTVGHEQWTGTTWALRTVDFRMCSNVELCAELADPLKYPPGPLAVPTSSSTNKWVHVAVVRKSKVRFAVGSLYSQFSSTYIVYVNGYPLELAAYPGCTPTNPTTVTCRGQTLTYDSNGATFAPGESAPLPGPRRVGVAQASPTEIDGQCAGDTVQSCEDQFATQTALKFGSFYGATGTGSQYFTGELDEWRFWNGVRSRTDILEKLNRPLNPRDEASYGDPSTITDPTGAPTTVSASNYLTASALMAVYDFDEVVGGVTPPIYPKRDDARLPQPPAFNRAVYSGVLQGVQLVPTDDTGVVFFSNVRTGALDSEGRLVLATRPEVPGLYQVGVFVSLADRVAEVPVDFIVNVSDPSGPNLFMPTIAASAGVELEPASNTLYEGFEFAMSVTGTDAQVSATIPPGCALNDNNGCALTFETTIGFTVGPMPRGVRFSAVEGANPGTMRVAWTPCGDSVGMNVLCFEAVDRHTNVSSGVALGAKASQMLCVKAKVLPDPAPELELDPPEVLMLTMGREGTLVATATDANCADAVRTHVAFSADLQPTSDEEVDGGTCTSRVRTLRFKPGLRLGGYRQELCVTAVDSGGACEGNAPKEVTTCVMVHVARCVYALQQDQQLQELAGQLGMDWVRLWSLNADLPHPDNLVYMDQEIFVGHKYKVAANDRVEEVAKRMGMPLEQMHDLNADLRAGGGAGGGLLSDYGITELCVVPNSCTGMGRTTYSDLVYSDGKFFLSNAGDGPPAGTRPP